MLPVRQLRQVGPRQCDAAPRRLRPANAPQFRTLVIRASSLGHTPEGKLWATVLATAWGEAARGKQESIRFFVGGHAQFIADMIGYPGDIAQLFREHNAGAGAN